MALFVGALGLFANLDAKPHTNHHTEQKTTLSKLRLTLAELQNLASGITDQNLLTDVKEVISYSRKVLRKGSKAKFQTVKKALHSTRKAIHIIKNGTFATSLQNRATQLETNVTKHFTQIKGEMIGIVNSLKANAPYNVPVAITALPYTISSPGKYYVPKNLVYNGSQTAITIAADNVILNFYNNALTVLNKNAIGIAVDGVNEFTLENGIIQGALQGVVISESSGLHFQNTFFDSSGVWVDKSQSVSIDSCGFEGNDTAASKALVIDNTSQHISVTSSTFASWQDTIVARDVTGLLIDGCLLRGSSVVGGNLLTLGTSSSQANSIKISNTTFLQDMLIEGFDALLFLNGSSCLLENIIIDATTGHVATYNAAAMHIGSSQCSYNNILAKDSIIKGTNEYGLYIENSFFTNCIGCQFTNASLANVLLDNAVGCLIKNCKISDATGSGVLIKSSASTNAIINCEISNNGQDGLVIEESAQKNHIIKNDVFDNANFGIANSEASTATFFNISCNNATSDCPLSGIHPEQAPGVASVVPGSNICCVP